MIRINLLPHREEKRKARIQRFYLLTAGVALSGVLAVVAEHMVLDYRTEHQDARNAFLKKEVAKLDKEIADIKNLREQINGVLARKRVIESLQANRAQTVMLLNELAQKTPEGIYLRSVKQAGARVTLSGHAQSNARVSALMRNLDESPALQNPQLIEIKAVSFGTRRVNEFALMVDLSRPKELAEAPAAPATVAKADIK